MLADSPVAAWKSMAIPCAEMMLEAIQWLRTPSRLPAAYVSVDLATLFTHRVMGCRARLVARTRMRST